MMTDLDDFLYEDIDEARIDQDQSSAVEVSLEQADSRTAGLSALVDSFAPRCKTLKACWPLLVNRWKS